MVTTPPESGASPASIEIIVPAHNEARRLPDALSALCRKAASLPVRAAVLVVDSASPLPGRGQSSNRTGLLATRAPFVGFCDADMATDLSALDTVLSLLAAGNPLVVGSRGLAASVVTVRHSVVRRGGAAVFRAMARQIVPGTTDTQCGFKFFAGPLARAAACSMRTDGFAFDVELLAACRRLGATVTEIPVQWRDVPGSTFSASRHSAAVFRDLAKIWLRSMEGRGGPTGEQGGVRCPPPSSWAAPVQRPGYRDALPELAGGASR